MSGRVIVVGGGLAGIVAALEAQRAGAQVLLLDRGGVGLGSNSALANGVFAGPGPGYPGRDYVADTLRIGRGLNRRWMVELAAAEAAAGFRMLEELGLRWQIEGGLRWFREERADVPRGAQMMRVLVRALAGRPGLQVETGFQVSELLQEDGRVGGVAGWDRCGRWTRVAAGAVVLATGGVGAAYARNDNQKGTMGQGYRLAARAGVALRDLEFVQFYPLVLAERKLPGFMLYPDYPPECRLVNARGEDLLVKYGLGDLNHAIKVRRDQFAAALFAEGSQSRVALDLTGVPQSAWRRYPLAMLRRFKFDFARVPVAVAPGAHFCMGGVDVDVQGQTSRPGLFACGEVVAGLHGANRRGGNALTECLVFGRLAGRGAAEEARQGGVSAPQRSAVDPGWGAGPATAATYQGLRRRLRNLAWTRAGIVRSRPTLRAGLDELAVWGEELRALQPRTPAEARWHEDLDAAALVLRAVLTASLGREESRGAFLSEDFPEPDQDAWAVRSELRYDPAGARFRLRFRPVD